VALPADDLCRGFDAVLLAGGSRQPRDLAVAGRELSGVHFALDFLTQQNQRCAGAAIPPDDEISAYGRRVVVIGGGDTGADCVGTSLRHGATQVTSFELMPQPPLQRAQDNPWPEWPRIFRTASSHEEGGERMYAVQTKRLIGDARGGVAAIEASHVSWQRDAQGRMQMEEIPDTTFTLPCDMVLLAMGFTGPERSGMIAELGLALSPRGTVMTDAHKMTSRQGVFVAGDMGRGQSLIVWAIAEGRSAAAGADRWLMGETQLPAPIAPSARPLQ
jgi:glutamate synthase (NADPH/NADH) small chain